MQTRAVAEYTASAVGGTLPADLDRWSRRTLLDTLTVLLAGQRTRTAEAAVRTAVRTEGRVPIPGTGCCSSAVMAAFAGAVAANALDFEDGHYLGGGIHAGSAVVPALLAVSRPATPLRQLRAAMVAGYEIAIRAGFLLSPAHGQPYRTSGHAASLGTAAAVTALLGGDTSAIASAVRIAASHAPVSHVHAAGACESVGWAAATGITAAFLALDGFTSEEGDARFAFPVAPSPFDDQAAMPFADSLGTHSEAVNCYVKPYACCRLIHAAIDGLRELRAELPDDPRSIGSITVGTQSGAVTMDNRDPLTLEQAQFSIPVMVAVYLLDGELGPGQAAPSRWRHPAVRELAARIEVIHDPRTDNPADGSYPATLQVTAGGRQLEHAVWDASGSVTNPLTPQQLASKAQDCLRYAYGPGDAAADSPEAGLVIVLNRDESTASDLLAAITGPQPPSERIARI